MRYILLILMDIHYYRLLIIIHYLNPTSPPSHCSAGVLGIIFLALLCMGFLIGRYMARHKGDYRTHEADNADIAPDADWAVQHATTGPQVKKNTEMYI